MNKKEGISYQELLKDPEVKNWNENIKAGSIITEVSKKARELDEKLGTNIFPKNRS